MVLRHGLTKQDITCGISESPPSGSVCAHVRAPLCKFTSMEVSLYLSLFFSPLQQHKQKFSHSSETYFFEPNEYVDWLWFLIHGSHSAVAHCVQLSTVINQHCSATKDESRAQGGNNGLLSYPTGSFLLQRFLSLGGWEFKFDTITHIGPFLQWENLKKNIPCYRLLC